MPCSTLVRSLGGPPARHAALAGPTADGWRGAGAGLCGALPAGGVGHRSAFGLGGSRLGGLLRRLQPAQHHPPGLGRAPGWRRDGADAAGGVARGLCAARRHRGQRAAHGGRLGRDERRARCGLGRRFAGTARRSTPPARAEQHAAPGVAVWGVAAFRRLLAVHLLNGTAAAIPATLLVFFVTDRLQTPDQQGLYLAAYFLAAAASLPLWLRLVAWMGGVRAWQLGMGLAVLAFCSAAVLRPGTARPSWPSASAVAQPWGGPRPAHRVAGRRGAARPATAGGQAPSSAGGTRPQAQPRAGCGWPAAAANPGLRRARATPQGWPHCPSPTRCCRVSSSSWRWRCFMEFADETPSAHRCLGPAAGQLRQCPRIGTTPTRRRSWTSRPTSTARWWPMASSPTARAASSAASPCRCRPTGRAMWARWRDFVYSDGSKERRVWTITQLGPQRYKGRPPMWWARRAAKRPAMRCAGVTRSSCRSMAASTSGFRRLVLLMDDKVLLNKATMSKFGFKLGG